MAKLHMRMSVEIEVTDEELRKIMDYAKRDVYHDLEDISCNEISDLGIDLMKNMKYADDWDDGGYVPETWLANDLDAAGITSEYIC